MGQITRIINIAAVGALAAIAAQQAMQKRRPQAVHRASHARNDLRALDWAAGLLALSALTDSAVEHYRGSFHNKMMYVPLAVSAASLAGSVKDAIEGGTARRRTYLPTGLPAFATGIIGAGFHVFNVLKRPGQLSWVNLFYGAPLGAPVALSLAGLIRLMAHAIGNGRRRIFGVSAPRLLAGLVSAGLFGTTAEAALLHFRGAYQNRAMYLPVTVSPLVAATVGVAAVAPGCASSAARWGLSFLAGMGIAGSAFHAYGIHRAMGGWRNWSQNVLDGPPLPAPPAYTALALAGLAALKLMERVDR